MLPLMHALTGAPVFPYCNVRESDSEAVRTGSTQELAPTAPSLTAEKPVNFFVIASFGHNIALFFENVKWFLFLFIMLTIL